MYDEAFNNGFWAGLSVGIIGILLTIMLLSALFGHTTVNTMAEIQAPVVYKVTVDGVQTMCIQEPDIKHDYLELAGCTGMPDHVMRIKRYLALSFVEVRSE